MVKEGWYVRVDGSERGPLAPADVKRLVAAGELRRTDSIRRGRGGEWRAAADVKGLFPDVEEDRWEVFVSHSHHDKPTADALVHVLEERRLRCWIAPRDIVPGMNWSGSIMEGLSRCRVLVLIFSRHSNVSQQVLQEVERAVNRGLAVVPFRIDDVPIEPALELFIGSRHWLDAIDESVDLQARRLADAVQSLLASLDGAPPPKSSSPAPATVPAPPVRGRPRLVAGLAALAAVALAAAGAWWFLQRDGAEPADADRGSDAVAGADRDEARSSAPARESSTPAVDPAVAAREAERAAEQSRRAQARERLHAAFAAGTTWTALARSGASVRELELSVLANGPTGLVLAVDDPRDPWARHVLAGAATDAADGPAYVLQSSSSGPSSVALDRGSVSLSLADDAPAGRWGRWSLALERTATSAAAAPTAAAWTAALAPGARWTGTLHAEPARSVVLTVTRHELGGARVRVALEPADDPWRVALFEGALDAGASAGWALEARPVAPAHSPVPGAVALGPRPAPLWLRLGDGGALLGVAGGERLRLERAGTVPVDPDLAADAARPRARWTGALHRPEGPALSVALTFVDDRADGAYLRAVAEEAGEPGVVAVLEGALVREAEAARDGWAVRLKKLHRPEWTAHPASQLLGYWESDVVLRPLGGDRLVGWCGKERLELARDDDLPDDVPVGADARAARLLEQCAAGSTWNGTARWRDQAALAVELRFTACSADGSSVAATFAAPAQGVRADFTGRLDLDPAEVDGWPLVLTRTGDLEKNAGKAPLLGFWGGKTVRLRVGADGRMRGWVEKDEWIELTRTGGAVEAGAGARTAAAADPYDAFWAQVAEADGHLARGDWEAARAAYRDADEKLPLEDDYELLVDVRLAETVWVEARSQRVPEDENRILKKAAEQFEKISRRAPDVRDSEGVSMQAWRLFRICLTNGGVAAKARDGGSPDKVIRKYQKPCDEAYLELERSYGDERDASGRRLVDVAQEKIRDWND